MAVSSRTRGGLDSRDGDPARRRVSDLQRARVLTAMTEVVRERGVRNVAVAHVLARSGVSRRTFYDLFEDREECLLAAFEHAVERAAVIALPAYGAAGTWQERIRAGVEAVLGFLDAEPAMGSLCVVGALAAEGAVLERRARVVGALADLVHEGGCAARTAAVGGAKANGRSPARGSAKTKGGSPARGSADRGRSGRLPRIVAEGAVGAVLAVIHARMTAPDPKPLSGLLGPLTGMIVLPYLGPDAARRELTRRVPRHRAGPARSAGDPLRELDMRLTYRTVRVLLAISELGGRGSGPSGRQIADAAGIADPGQMSKLLWRLEHLGLIANEASARGRGEPNAWSLAPRGREVERAIRAQASF
jgi:AcrR family transcriptional regulator/DNA-binding MarR family transcriptional regulator